MAIYKDILTWSESKFPWIQDALRRLVTQSKLNDNDIDEIFQLLKKENGYKSIELEPIPFSLKDIPEDVSSIDNPIVLLSIERPQNINALHPEAELVFNEKGLNIIYGDNGSGKSGYARILKKVCWSRDKNVTLKRNIFSNSENDQSFLIKYSDNDYNYEFEWTDGTLEGPPQLNSINVFDVKCAYLYINSDNPTEYKPVGLDILERLIEVFLKISEKIEWKICQFKIEKPHLDEIYNNTKIFNWYHDLENKSREEISETLVFSEENTKRLKELILLLSKSNPEKENIELSQKRIRYNILRENLEEIEETVSSESIKKFQVIQNKYKIDQDAYLIASKKYKGDDPLDGIGSESWRLLWEAAKKYATEEVHPDIEEFPADLSIEYCVFCQQPLNEVAKKRIERFDSFISDTTSSEFQKSKIKLENLIKNLLDVGIEIDTTVNEIDKEIENFKEKVTTFQTEIDKIIGAIVNDLKSHKIIQVNNKIERLSILVRSRIDEIDRIIKSNIKLIAERKDLHQEQNELSALNELYKQKQIISDYYEEHLHRHWLSIARTKTNTRAVSQKIGELQGDIAIQEQHKEFISHLTILNSDLAQKVELRKTRTTQGETFQQCTFQDIDEDLNEILSEGEQKIITLSNFIAECTINNSKNSVVFDDPVTSLDQNYREKIAEIIANLANDRQIIVLTHDLNFVRLLIDEYSKITSEAYKLIGLKSYKGISGLTTDEIPYLSKNIQERIDSIRKTLKQVKGIDVTQIEKIEEKTEIACKRMRFLIEKSVEEILANKTIQRFSKNINVKAKQLSSYVVTEKSDIDFILNLFGKYSVTEHDGSESVEFQKPTPADINADILLFENWKNGFQDRLDTFIKANRY
jgi:energy-coupling factor transporter ATP-binding protein EcfA2